MPGGSSMAKTSATESAMLGNRDGWSIKKKVFLVADAGTRGLVGGPRSRRHDARYPIVCTGRLEGYLGWWLGPIVVRLTDFLLGRSEVQV